MCVCLCVYVCGDVRANMCECVFVFVHVCISVSVYLFVLISLYISGNMLTCVVGLVCLSKA